MNVSAIISRSADMWPEKTAVIDRHGRLDYRTLSANVLSLTDKLRKSGVEPGHGVGIMTRNSREFIIAAFAAMRSGATILPILHQIRRQELDGLLGTTGLHAVIDDGSGIRPSGGPFSDLEIAGADTLRLTWTDAGKTRLFADFVDDPAFVRFTSGTTGSSKGVVISHKGILERTAAANKGLALSSEDTVICVLPMAFHFLVSTVLYLEAGATIVICPDHLAGTILDLANMHSATFLYASPMHYRLLCADNSGRGLKSLKRAVSTSSGLPPGLSQNFFDRYGLPVSQAYGIIEIGLPLINLDRPLEYPNSVGRALPGFEVSILDDRQCPLPAGEGGQLAFRGAGMFSGYLDPPRLLKDVLVNGWFLSGDLAVKDEDGYVTVVGRSKSMINVAGNKVFPEEVESVVNRHPDVEASRVSRKPHLQMGEVVHADIVLKDSSRDLDTEELLRFCRLHLTSYKVPHSVTIVKELAETLSGKIRRGEE